MSSSRSVRTALYSQWQAGNLVVADVKQGGGKYFFVDSGSSAASDATGMGFSPDKPFATLDYAFSACTAGDGDTIVVMPGHFEDYDATTTGFDADVQGVKVIGLGEGSLRPRFDFNHANSVCTVGADDVTLSNLVFRPSVTVVSKGLELESGVTGCVIEDCEFAEGEAGDGTDEFVLTIKLTSGNHDTQIRGNTFITNAACNGCTDCIDIAAAASRVVIEGNRFDGNWSTAAISDGAACTALLIKDNVMKVKDGEPGIEMNANTTGQLVNNKIESTTATADSAIVAAKMSWFGNTAVVTDGTEAVTIGGGEEQAALQTYNLDHLMGTATADTSDQVDLSAEVADNTVLSHIITDDGDSSDYDRRYHSLEALAKILQIQMGYQLKSVAGSGMPIAIWYVDANISSSGDGKTPATAFKTMAEAITASSNSVDDWILVFDYSGGDAGTITINKAFVHIIGNANACMPYPRIFPASAAPGFTLGDAADRVEIANLVIGGGDQTQAAIYINSAAGAYGVYIHDCVIGRDATAPGLYGVYVPSGSAAPYLTIENNKFYGADGAGIAAAGSAIRIAGNATRCNILHNYIQDIGRTATPAIWLDGGVTNPRIVGNQIKHDTDTGTGGAITLGASVDDGWICDNAACDGKDDSSQNPFVDAASSNGWARNYNGASITQPA